MWERWGHSRDGARRDRAEIRSSRRVAESNGTGRGEGMSCRLTHCGYAGGPGERLWGRRRGDW